MRNLKKIFIGLILILCTFVIFLGNVNAKEVNVYMFYGKTCPHCEEAMRYLESVKDKYDLNIIKYEVWENDENRKIMDNVSEIIDINVSGVPFCVINNKGIIGYSSGITDETYKYHIKKASKADFIDNVGISLGLVKKEHANQAVNLENKLFFMDIPMLGDFNLKNISLPIVSILLGIMDGLNLCSLWTLLFIASFLLNINSKKRVYIFGMTFLLCSALIYLSFLLSWLSFSKVLDLVSLIRLLISVVAITIGTIRINSYLKETNSDLNLKETTKSRKISHKIVEFIHKKSFIISFIGIFVFAVLTNIIEQSCSAGFGETILKLLLVNDVSVFEYIFYIAIYMLFFVMVKLIIFVILVKVAELIGLFTKYNKYASLISGILMFIIGVLLLSKPEWVMFDF